jgi:hypothetical protein
MVTILLAAALNLHYIPDLIEFLVEQYNLAAKVDPGVEEGRVEVEALLVKLQRTREVDLQHQDSPRDAHSPCQLG